VTKVANIESEQDDMTMNQKDAAAPDRAQFPDLEQDPKPREPMKDLDFILDIPLEVSVELGRTRMLINELLQLGQGSVIELNKLAGEPLEIFINRKLVARGEAVVVNEKFGVRLTDIISPMERVRQLG
jgi:flagellar motor switch protein FliN/FliY